MTEQLIKLKKIIENGDDTEPLMAEIQQALRLNDTALADDLCSTICDESNSLNLRIFTLETMSAARASKFYDLVLRCVLSAFKQEHSRLHFAALAAMSDLPNDYRVKLRHEVSKLILLSTDQDVVRLAKVIKDQTKIGGD